MEKDEIVIRLHRPDRNEMLFFFLCGVLMSVPLTLFVDQFASSLLVSFDSFSATLISTAFFAPFIEEFSKAFPLFYRHGETERSIFNLALCVGLGFGIVEMLTYVLALGVPLIDRVPGLFFHPASTSITAFGLAKKKPLPFYMTAVALHFSNNFLVVTNLFAAIAVPSSAIIVAITVFTSWQLHSRTKERFID
jgi:RsiW-degrading membrane proteinase PrsW (M82 family)